MSKQHTAKIKTLAALSAQSQIIQIGDNPRTQICLSQKNSRVSIIATGVCDTTG